MDTHMKAEPVPVCLGVEDTISASTGRTLCTHPSPNQTGSPLQAPLVMFVLSQGPSMSIPPHTLSDLSHHLLCPQVLIPLQLTSLVVSVSGEGDRAMGRLAYGLLLQQLSPWSAHFWAQTTNPIINQFFLGHLKNVSKQFSSTLLLLPYFKPKWRYNVNLLVNISSQCLHVNLLKIVELVVKWEQDRQDPFYLGVQSGDRNQLLIWKQKF